MKIGVLFDSTNGNSLISAAIIAKKYPYVTPYDVSANGYTSKDLAIAAITNTPDVLYSVGITLSGTQQTNATNASALFTYLIDTGAYYTPMLVWILLYSTKTPPITVVVAGRIPPSPDDNVIKTKCTAITLLTLTSFVTTITHPVWARFLGTTKEDLPLIEMISGITFYLNYI